MELGKKVDIVLIWLEESGEQCTVVFALIVTEPASECVRSGWGVTISPLPQAVSVTIHAKTTLYCPPDSSMHTAHRPPPARCYQLIHTEAVNDKKNPKRDLNGKKQLAFVSKKS